MQVKTLGIVGVLLSLLIGCTKQQDVQQASPNPEILSSTAGTLADTTPVSAVFGGGPFYSGGTTVMNTLKASGFTTVILWSIHLRTNGDLWLNDVLVVSNGAYVGNPDWPGQLATLKQAPTSVRKIEVSVGSWGVNDFEMIRDLIAAQGTDSNSILYKNFLALKNATGADAVDLDDESLYDVNTTVQFSLMCGALGMNVSLCPYTNSSFWASVLSETNTQRPGTIDAVYLQCYAGGAGNNPATWNAALGMKVYPGLWCRNGATCSSGDNPTTVQTKMANWKASAGITGGFMWLYDDMQKCSSQGTPAQYAAAINNGVQGIPPVITTGVTFYQNTNYGGSASQLLQKGNYTMAQLQAMGVPNNWASSVKVPTGWKVIMYNHDNFSGTYTSWTRTSNTASFTSLSPSANDKMTSCRIQ